MCRFVQRMSLSTKIFLVIGVVAVVVLFFLDPSQHALMPKCVFKLLTGYSCPGCGFQRAVHAFLHGDVMGAVRFNLFLVVGVPYLLIVAVASIIPKTERTAAFRRFAFHKCWVYLYVTLFCIWWVVRNILHI